MLCLIGRFPSTDASSAKERVSKPICRREANDLCPWRTTRSRHGGTSKRREHPTSDCLLRPNRVALHYRHGGGIPMMKRLGRNGYILSRICCDCVVQEVN